VVTRKGKKMKTSFLFLLMLVLAAAVGLTIGCSGDDDDDDSGDDDVTDDDAVDDDAADDDATDDDAVDDDTADDDVTDDDTEETTIILDDGDANGGMRTISYPSSFVQTFTPPAYPATLTNVSFYIDRADGIGRETVLIIMYATAKGEPTGAPVYTSAPFTFATGEAWNDIDLTGVTELDTPIASGEFWIGIQAVDALDEGPFIGFDSDGTAGGIWYWDGLAWTADIETDVLMIRPTVQYPAL